MVEFEWNFIGRRWRWKGKNWNRKWNSNTPVVCFDKPWIEIISSPDISVGGLIFYRDSSFLRRLSSELAERNSTKIGHMLGSKCDLKTHVQNLRYPLPYKNHLFGPTSQLNGNFNGLYLRNGTWYRQLVKCVDNYKGSPTSSQNVMNFGPQTASNWTVIFTHLWNFCFLRHCQASQTDVSKQNSTKLCQTADGKSRYQYAVEQLGSSPRKNGGQETFAFVRFLTASTLNGEYLLNETWLRQLGKGAEKYEESPTLSKNLMNFGPQTA